MKFGIGFTFKVDENFESVLRKKNIDIILQRSEHGTRYRFHSIDSLPSKHFNVTNIQQYIMKHKI